MLNLVYLGMTFPLKLALSHIVKFCSGWLVMVFPRVSRSPILGMGCRRQIPKFPTIFDNESQRSKTATDFSFAFPLNCPSNKQKRPDVHSCRYQANSQNLENTVITRNRTAGLVATSLLSQGLTTALNVWPARGKWLRLSKFNSCPRALIP